MIQPRGLCSLNFCLDPVAGIKLRLLGSPDGIPEKLNGSPSMSHAHTVG